MSAVIARIDLAALKFNYKTAQKLAPNSRNFAVIKANAYGHGSIACAKALDQADGFAVATIEEAIELREHNVKKPIVVLSRFSQADEANAVQEFKLSPVIHSHYQLDLLIANPHRKQSIDCWLKIDTGMNRLGFEPAVLAGVLERINSSECLNAAGLMSHLACADETDNDFTYLQLQTFDQLAVNAQLPRSIANSAGIMAWPGTHKNWNRPGLMLYGVSPLRSGSVIGDTLRPVMDFSSVLISVSTLKKGDGIGYAQTFVAPNDMRVGIVACGYADGYPRQASTNTPVLVRDQRSRLLGRVSMDTLAVDLSSVPQAQVGSPVLLWGNNLSVNEIANHAGTIAYELLTRVSRRVPRQYVS